MKTPLLSTPQTTRSILRIALIATILLSIPLIAMLFTDEVNWDVFDFIVVGILLTGTGLVYELFINRLRAPGYRIILSMLLVATLFLIWAELSVGIFGTPFAGQ